MNNDRLSKILKSLHEGLTRLLGDHLEAILLYGSQARGDARPDSDIDVLVVLRGAFSYFEMIDRTGALAADLSLQNDTVISLTFITVDDYSNSQLPFLSCIRQEAIPV